MPDNYQGHRDFVQDPQNHKLWKIDLTAGNCRDLIMNFGMTAAVNADCDCNCMLPDSEQGGNGKGNYSTPTDYTAHKNFIGDVKIRTITVDLRLQTCRELVWRFGITTAHNLRCDCNCTGTSLDNGDPTAGYTFDEEAITPNYDIPVEDTLVIDGTNGQIIHQQASSAFFTKKISNKKQLVEQPTLFDAPPAPPKKKPQVKKAAPQKKAVAKKKTTPKKAATKKKVAVKKKPVVKKSVKPGSKKATVKKAVKKVKPSAKKKQVIKKKSAVAKKKGVAAKKVASKKAVAGKVKRKAVKTVKKVAKKSPGKAVKKSKAKRK